MSAKTVSATGEVADATASQQLRSPNGRSGRPAEDMTSSHGEQPMLTEHTGHGRLVAQRGLFAGPSELVSKDLYAEVTRGTVSRSRQRITLDASAAVSGNTYFGDRKSVV